MHPDPCERMPDRQRLRALVLVMREDEVEPATVDPELRAELLRGHRRAFDVPPGAADPPGRLPRGVLALLRRLPEGEVARVLLAARWAPAPRPGRDAGPTGRRSLEAGDAEVDVAVRPCTRAPRRAAPRSVRRSPASSRSRAAASPASRARSRRCPRGTSASPRAPARRCARAPPRRSCRSRP